MTRRAAWRPARPAAGPTVNSTSVPGATSAAMSRDCCCCCCCLFWPLLDCCCCCCCCSSPFSPSARTSLTWKKIWSLKSDELCWFFVLEKGFGEGAEEGGVECFSSSSFFSSSSSPSTQNAKPYLIKPKLSLSAATTPVHLVPMGTSSSGVVPAFTEKRGGCTCCCCCCS